MTDQSLTSDAIIWATLLLIAIGGAAVLCGLAVWILSRAGGRLSPDAARALYRRIAVIAGVVFIAAFIGGLIVGAFQ